MLTIRTSTSEDFADVMKLLRQLWPSQHIDESKLSKVFMRSLKSDRDILLSAVLNNRVVGFGAAVIKNSFWQGAFVGYITTLIVDEQFRNKGIGRNLLDEFAGFMRKSGCMKMELDSGFHREQAHLMYEHYGFKKRAYLFSKDV